MKKDKWSVTAIKATTWQRLFEQGIVREATLDFYIVGESPLCFWNWWQPRRNSCCIYKKEKAMPKKKDAAPHVEELQILQVHHGQMDVYVVGESPLVENRMSEKAKHQLLHPRGRLSTYEKAVNVKHNPVEEFQAAPYRLPSGDTLLAMPSTAFKGALSTAALDLPGTKKAQIARLTFVEGEYVPIYGIPKLYMAVVRSADMNRTPDIRTRAIVQEWCAKFTVHYVEPLLRPNAIATLVAASGIYIGVGDGRPEKGKLSFGRFRVVEKNDRDFLRIAKFGGRKLQTTAMNNPEAYDSESLEMLTWYNEEVKRRNYESTQPQKGRKGIRPNGHVPPPKADRAHQDENLEV